MNQLKKLMMVALVALTLVGFAKTLSGQVRKVAFNLVNNDLNAGVELPAEEIFFITGLLPEGVELVRLDIHRGKIRNTPDLVTTWKQPFDIPVSKFEVAVTSPLRSNQEYIFQFSFFRRASPAQILLLQQSLHNNVQAYIDANYEAGKKGFVSMSSKLVIVNNLNSIVKDGTSSFEHYIATPFPGFSDIVLLKVDKLQEVRMKNARFNIFKSGRSEREAKVTYAMNLLGELKSMVKAEIDQYLSESMLVLTDVREVIAVTEKTFTYLPVNFGYGVSYFGGGFKDLDYDTSPYLGLSFQIGNRTFSKFLGNASISTGLFLNNMKNSDGDKVSGIFLDRPLYLALGYNVLTVLRFNVGTVFTSVETFNMNGEKNEKFHVYPFLGLSLEMNVWLGFNRKK